MAKLKVTLGGSVLPGDIVQLKRGDELLWSEGSGRSATNGLMTGSIVARKQTYTLQWGVIDAAAYAAIRAAADSTAFMALSIEVAGASMASCTVYRGAVSGELLNILGGAAYYKNVSLELVEV